MEAAGKPPDPTAEAEEYQELPDAEIDHAWVTFNFPFYTEAFVADWSGSDHRALVIVIHLDKPTADRTERLN